MYPIHPSETHEGFLTGSLHCLELSLHRAPRALLSTVFRNRHALSLLKRCDLPKMVYRGEKKSVFSAMSVSLTKMFNVMGTLTLTSM